MRSRLEIDDFITLAVSACRYMIPLDLLNTNEGKYIPSADHFAIPVACCILFSVRRMSRETECQWYTSEVGGSVDSSVKYGQTGPFRSREKTTDSGRVIFCKFKKKSLFKMVEAESILPDRLSTTCFTSSGSATSSPSSALSRGFRDCSPSASSSFSNVLMT